MDKNQIREVIARRVARELKDGDVVNLGIGLPTLVPNYLDPNTKVHLQSENGLIGMGRTPGEEEIDPHYINAGGGSILPDVGAASFDSATSFAIIRGGHVDVSVLGALQVDVKGNLANWNIPGKMVPGMGGAMDLLTGTRKVILAMEHTAKGAPKIMKECTLPLTAKEAVDMIITEMCVIFVTEKGLEVAEIHPDFTKEDVEAATDAPLIFREDLKTMEF
ncbi:MAG: 3-oxoacid CoA-transferase subunit B [Porphyromonas sp.]|nr:3-oxoacid CoA-transferase subunit B [Porphyromonas sp.]